MSDAVVYTSKVRIERVKGPLRRVYVPVEKEAFFVGVRSEIAEHYKTDLMVHEPHAATLDYVVDSRLTDRDIWGRADLDPA